jgi:prostaglandin reductase 1
MVKKAKVFIYAKLHKGEPKLSDFELKEEEIDPLKDGEILIAAMYFGANAGLRAYQELYPIGSIIVGGQVAKFVKLN